MKILVTGATGFVGSQLCPRLEERGDQVSVLSRSASGKNPESPYQHFQWNPVLGEIPQESLKGVEGVVHLAGESVVGRWTGRKRQAIRKSGVEGTRHLVDSIEGCDKKPGVLIAASAIGFYGDAGEEAVDEDSPPGDDFLADVCREWEEQSGRAEAMGVRVVRLRIGIVLGKGGGALEAMLLPFRLGLGGPLGSGRQWWSWIHLDDVVGIIIQSLQDESMSGAVNGTAPNPMRQKDFARVLGRVLSRPAFLPAPSLALKMVLGGFSTELLSSKRVMPARLTEWGYPFRFPELEPALEAAVD